MAQSDLLDHSNFFKSIPIQSLGPGPSSSVVWKQNTSGCGILLRDSTKSDYGSSNIVYVAKNLKDGQTYGDTPMEDRISFELPLVDLIITKDGMQLKNVNEVVTLGNGNVKIVLDMYKKWLDTGGYYTRQFGEIVLNKDGEIVSIDARDYLASRGFMFFGSIGDFKEKKSVSCGT